MKSRTFVPALLAALAVFLLLSTVATAGMIGPPSPPSLMNASPAFYTWYSMNTDPFSTPSPVWQGPSLWVGQNPDEVGTNLRGWVIPLDSSGAKGAWTVTASISVLNYPAEKLKAGLVLYDDRTQTAETLELTRDTTQCTGSSATPGWSIYAENWATLASPSGPVNKICTNPVIGNQLLQVTQAGGPTNRRFWNLSLDQSTWDQQVRWEGGIPNVYPYVKNPNWAGIAMSNSTSAPFAELGVLINSFSVSYAASDGQVVTRDLIGGKAANAGFTPASGPRQPFWGFTTPPAFPNTLNWGTMGVTASAPIRGGAAQWIGANSPISPGTYLRGATIPLNAGTPFTLIVGLSCAILPTGTYWERGCGVILFSSQDGYAETVAVRHDTTAGCTNWCMRVDDYNSLDYNVSYHAVAGLPLSPIGGGTHWVKIVETSNLQLQYSYSYDQQTWQTFYTSGPSPWVIPNEIGPVVDNDTYPGQTMVGTIIESWSLTGGTSGVGRGQ